MRTDPDHYRSFGPTPEFFERFIEWVDEFREPKSLAAKWPAVRLELFEGEPGEEKEEQQLPIPDFARGYVVMACSERARKIIEALVNGQVEFLPLITPVGPYYEMNIQRLSCLDVEHSIIDYLYPEEKRKIFKVIKYAFHWERLEGQHIFWIREVGTTPTFVSDEFKRLVEENNLTGLLFYPVSLVEGQ
jgi:hypothetical protein